MSNSSRIFIYGPAGLLLLLCVLYSVFWHVQADTLGARLDRANGGEVLPGLVFAFAEKSVTGYPFRLDALLSGVTISRRGPKGETAWRAEQVALHTLSYRQDRLIFEAAGLQSYAEPPSRPGAAPRVFYFTPAIARASAVMSDGRLIRVDLDLWKPLAKEASQRADPTRVISADRAQLHLLARPDNTIDLVIQINNATIGAGFSATGSAFPLSLVDIRGKLTQGEAFADLRVGRKGLDASAEDWRKAAGAISVSNLALDWAGRHADLSGDLTLNANNQLAGNLREKSAAPNAGASAIGLAFTGGNIRLTGAAASSGLNRPAP